MADTKISALTLSTAATGDNLVVARGGLNFKVTPDTINDLTDAKQISISNVLKNTAGTITKGNPVAQVGYDGTNNCFLVELADSAIAAQMPSIGIANENITDLASGKVLISGEMTGLNTSSFASGDDLYVASGGGLTNVSPQGAEILEKVAQAGEIDGATGSVLISPQGKIDTVSPTTQVVANEEGDFPAPSGGVITLSDNTAYILGAPITTANRFVLGNNMSLSSVNPFGTFLTYTGSAVMFTGSDSTILINALGLNCPSATFAFDMESSNGTHSITANQLIIIATGGVANFTSMRSHNFNVFGCNSATTGLVFNGANSDSMSLSQFRINSTDAGFVGVDFGTTVFDNAEMSNLVLTGPGGAVGIGGAAASANISANNIATVTLSQFSDGLTPLNNISDSDIRWNFVENSGVPNSTINSEAYLNASRTVPITTQSVFEPIAGTDWLTSISERFDSTNTGILTYTAERDTKILVICTATVEKSGGGNDELELRIAVDGTTEVKSRSRTKNSTPTSITSIALLNILTGEEVRGYVANNEGTSDIIVSSCNLTIINGF